MLRSWLLMVGVVGAFCAGLFVGGGRPVIAQAPPAKNRLFEVRIYSAADRASRDRSVTRFRGEELGLMQKDHMRPMFGLWFPINDPPTTAHPEQRTKRDLDRTFMYVLEHDSRASANANWPVFMAGPHSTLRQRWPSNVPGTIQVESIYMESLDFTPVK